jgi:hypothetical protein
LARSIILLLLIPVVLAACVLLTMAAGKGDADRREEGAEDVEGGLAVLA